MATSSSRAEPRAEIGVLGGSGFYSLLEQAESVRVDTPYGEPSGEVTIGMLSGRRVAFLPRHGVDHRFPPHRVPYRANLWALRSLGVRQVVTGSAVGSLLPRSVAERISAGRRQRRGRVPLSHRSPPAKLE